MLFLQSGVVKDPTGLYKRGRAYETGYVVDGVSAQDPLAERVDSIRVYSFSNIEVITGGVGAEYGDVTSGGFGDSKWRERYEGNFSHKQIFR